MVMNEGSFKQESPKAVILAGGKGTRLKPYTAVLPKPLLPIGEQPILEILISRLSSAGIRNVIISVGHLAELIMTFFGKGEKWNLEIEYVIEDIPLGTMGPLKLIDKLGEHFFVMNGDILTDLDFPALYKAHIESDAVMTVATCRRDVPIDFGVLSFDPASKSIRSFEEKPTLSYHVSMGIYVLSQKCLKYIPENESFGFDQLILRLLNKGIPVHSYPYEGQWLDIGRELDYRQANEMINRKSPPPL